MRYCAAFLLAALLVVAITQFISRPPTKPSIDVTLAAAGAYTDSNLAALDLSEQTLPDEYDAIYVSISGNDSAQGNLDSPFQTLERARDEIRSWKKQGPLKRPVVVFLREGSYFRSMPFVLGADDSGTSNCPVVYSAFADEQVTVDGGVSIDGWRVENGLWVADLSAADAVQEVRLLYVNGQLRTRARTPNHGFYRVASLPAGGIEVGYHTDCQSFGFRPGDINPKWRNLEDVEVVVYHFWTDSHLPIRTVDARKNLVTFAHKAGKVFTDDFSQRGARYIVENVFEGLDQPGEWYFDRVARKLFYKPLPNEKIGDVTAVVPKTEKLLEVTGRSDKKQIAKNLRFRKLRFAHSHFQLPAGNSNDLQGAASIPAAITLSGAEQVVFDNCELFHLGTAAIDVQMGCRGIVINKCHIHHIAAGAIRMDGAPLGEHPRYRTSHNRIVDNRIEHYGQIYPSAVGVLLEHTADNLVARNHIHHGRYTAVSVGWTWGYQPNISRNNVIEFNHIHDIGGGLLSDMGGIYTLGVSPGTVVRNNLIHDIRANSYGGCGIYNDEGSAHILVENNVVYNTSSAGYNIHYGRDLTVRNNIFAFGGEALLHRERIEPHMSVHFENNIVYCGNGAVFSGNWNDKAHRVYLNPIHKNGVRAASSTFEMDRNVYFSAKQSAGSRIWNGLSFRQWQQRGKDLHSVFANPGFADAANFDFRLPRDSAAIELGFRPIDLRGIPAPHASRND
jgi:hypothetical protein